MITPPFDPARSPATIAVSFDMSAIADPRLKLIHAYWESRCRGRPMPARSDIDPLDLRSVLPFIALVDVLDRDPRDFRFRLLGTHFREIIGMELTGLAIGEAFPPAFAAEVLHHWNNCVDRKSPAVGTGKFWIPERDYLEWEGIMLPLSPDGVSVNMMLGGGVILVDGTPAH